jgi:hypothetical protein
MSRKRKLSAKGRSTGTKPFVMLHNWIFDCPAYRSLKPGPRAVLWELTRRYNGSNNGRIACGAREMARALNVTDRQTIATYERELEAKGFIKAMRRGGFSVKVSDRRVTEWALTWEKVGDELPTKEFASWRPTEIDGTENPPTKGGKSFPAQESNVRQCSNVREFPSHKVRRAVGRRAE